MVTLIHMAIMRHFENRMNMRKNTNNSKSAVAVNPDQNINIAETTRHHRSPFGSTSLASLTVKRLSREGDTGDSQMSEEPTAEDAAMGSQADEPQPTATQQTDVDIVDAHDETTDG